MHHKTSIIRAGARTCAMLIKTLTPEPKQNVQWSGPWRAYRAGRQTVIRKCRTPRQDSKIIGISNPNASGTRISSSRIDVSTSVRYLTWRKADNMAGLRQTSPYEWRDLSLLLAMPWHFLLYSLKDVHVLETLKKTFFRHHHHHSSSVCLIREFSFEYMTSRTS